MTNNDTQTGNAGAPAGGTGAPAVPRRRVLRRLVPSLVVLVGLAAAGAWYAWPARAAPTPPSVDLAGVDPEVAAALTAARAAVVRTPRAPAAWGKYGKTLAAHRYLEEARAAFVEAERLQPEEPRWPYYQGLMLALNDDAAAIACYQHAIRLGGEPGAMHFRLAETLAGQGRLDEAEEQYRRLLGAPEWAPRAELGLARLAYQRGDLGAARSSLVRAAGQPATQKAAHTLLAEIAQRANDPAAATRERAAAAELPDDPDWSDPLFNEMMREKAGRTARLEYAMELTRQNLRRDAAAAFQELVKAYPDWDLGWLNYGRLLLENRAYLPAVETLRTAVRLSPDSVKGHFYLGLALAASDAHREAAGHFRETVRLKPDHALAHYNLGHCLKRLNDRVGALAAFREAGRCQPNMARAHTNLGELLAEQGDKAAAVAELRLSLELNPDDEVAKKLLTQLGHEK